MGVYQLFFMNSVPSYAAVSSTVDLCRRIDKSKVHIIEDGGWHFSFLKSPENISKKLTSYAHKEFSGVEFSDINIIKKKVEKYEDLFDANKKE